jgi:hypothetical protein
MCCGTQKERHSTLEEYTDRGKDMNLLSTCKFEVYYCQRSKNSCVMCSAERRHNGHTGTPLHGEIYLVGSHNEGRGLEEETVRGLVRGGAGLATLDMVWALAYRVRVKSVTCHHDAQQCALWLIFSVQVFCTSYIAILPTRFCCKRTVLTAILALGPFAARSIARYYQQ